jgi:hypothetical protein
MKMMSFEGFMNDFGKAAPNSMNMSVYRDNFQCACGRSHWFDESMDVVCQGGLMKIMVICPDDSSYITSLKIKTFMVFKFKGFESLCWHPSYPTAKTLIAFASIRQYMRRQIVMGFLILILVVAGIVYFFASSKTRRDTAIESRVNRMVSSGVSSSTFPDLYYEAAKSYAISKGSNRCGS